MCSKDDCCGGTCTTGACECTVHITQPAPIREVAFEVQIPSDMAEAYLNDEQPKKD